MNQPADLLGQLKIDRRPGARAPRRTWPWWLGGGVAVLALAALALRPGPPVLDLASVRAADDPANASVLDASGYVTARRQATVSAKITGKVAEVLIEEGMRVEEGQVLARLDATDAEAQRALSASQLEAARSQLGDVRAQLRLAEATLVRQRDLAGRQLVAASALDQATAERDALRARLASVERNVTVAQDALAIAGINVDNTVVRAPFAGVIIAKSAQPGEMISPISAGGGFTRTGIGTLVDMESLEVQVDVNEAYINRVQAGQPVTTTLNAYPEWGIPGRVIAIVPAADRTKATVRVRIALDERDARIVPDMGARVSFLAEPVEGAAPPEGWWLPARAVRGEGEAARVFAFADGRVREVAVVVAEARDADVRVTGALAAGERVVLGPPEGLADGDAVVAATP